MRNRVFKAAAALAVLAPTIALAQARPMGSAMAGTPDHTKGAIELTGSAGIFTIDRALNAGLAAAGIADPNPGRIMFGGVARFGYNVTENFNVGLGANLGTGNGAMLIGPFVAVTYTPSMSGMLHPFVTLGGGVSRFSGNSTHVTSTYAGHLGLGVRYFLQENLALRVEGRMAYENFDELNDPAFNGAGTVGLSYFMGGGPPADTDMDGVPDRRDRCASTPRGATVDARGCPSDTDRDGIVNGLDRCPNTPANTPVDNNGCTRDTDGDGIADNADRCANTPRGTPVDANGCPRDADGDGVNDSADRCPNTASGTPVDANGCPRDADGDGVHDGADRCANTARGTQVDANGCPVARDADGDGVVDDRDRCANTPAGRRVDSNGCPISEELTRVGAALRLQNVLFAGGSSRLNARSNASLNDMARQIRGVLETTPTARFEVGGHTDNRGSAAINNRLSQARAQSVMRYLVSQGVPAAALTAVGYGPSQPSAPNTTAAGRAQNRRVEIKRLN